MPAGREAKRDTQRQQRAPRGPFAVGRATGRGGPGSGLRLGAAPGRQPAAGWRMSGPHEPEGLPPSPDAMEAELGQLRAANRELVRINERLAAAVEQRTSEMLRARDARAQLLADVNREVRSPLDAIIGYGELLGEDLEALELYDLAHDVANIRTAGQALLSLLDDLIDPSKADLR